MHPTILALRVAAGLAAVTLPPDAASVTVLAVNDLPTVVNRSTAWLVGILAAVATLFLTIGGVRYVLAGGDPGEVEKAKSAFKSALVGYALAALAPIAVQIVAGILYGK
jgi:Type IV secretion system pilin